MADEFEIKNARFLNEIFERFFPNGEAKPLSELSEEQRDSYARDLFQFYRAHKHHEALDEYRQLVASDLFPVKEMLRLVDPDSSWSILRWVLAIGDDKTASALIKAGKSDPVSPFNVDHNSVTVLHAALWVHGCRESADALIEAWRASPELLFLADQNGNNALHYAINNRDKTAAQKLIEIAENARPELLFLANREGNTPLSLLEGLVSPVPDVILPAGMDLPASGDVNPYDSWFDVIEKLQFIGEKCGFMGDLDRTQPPANLVSDPMAVVEGVVQERA